MNTMNPLPPVTAVMLTCDRPERCRESAAHNAQALAALPGSELLIINNGRLPVDLPGTLAGVAVRVIPMPRNLGAEARNRALEEARNEWLFFLDDDVYIEAEHVRALAGVVSEYPETGAVGFRIFNRDQEEGSLLPGAFHGCAVGISREALRRAGGYPRGYRYYAEEYHVSFRLRQLGRTLRYAETGVPVQHVRDPAGRSKDHIIYRLMVNNTRLFTAFLPFRHLPDAWRDMAQRYRLVAIKERAEQGYRQGLRSLPWSVARGLAERKPLSPGLFAEFCMLSALDETLTLIRESALSEVVFCGVGRFPTLWAHRLKRVGLTARAYLDTNSCWKGQAIHGVPVFQDAAALLQQAGEFRLVFISGLCSLPETRLWNGLLRSRDFAPLSSGANPAPSPEKDTCKTSLFLHQITGMTAWRKTPSP